MEFTNILSIQAVQNVAMTVGGLAAAYMFNRLSGTTDIGRYVGSIHRVAGSYASDIGLNSEQIRTNPLQLGSLNSLFIADAETAAVTLVKDGQPQRQAVRLNNEAGQIALLQARGQLDRPQEIFSTLSRQINTQTVSDELCRESRKDQRIWAQPKGLKAVWAFFAPSAAYDNRASSIRQPLDYLAKVLAASPEPSVDLSGPCHIALKVPNPENGRADIVVMPTTRQEWKLFERIQSGELALPGGTRTAEAVRAALVLSNAPKPAQP